MKCCRLWQVMTTQRCKDRRPILTTLRLAGKEMCHWLFWVLWYTFAWDSMAPQVEEIREGSKGGDT